MARARMVPRRRSLVRRVCVHVLLPVARFVDQWARSVSTTAVSGKGRKLLALPSETDVDEKLTEILERDATMLQHFGIEFVRAGDGSAELAAVARAELLNSHDVAHGGLAFVLTDTAAAYAMASLGLHGVTVGSTISFTAPIRAGRSVEAAAHVTARGRTFCVIEAVVRSEDATCASATMRFMVRTGAT